MGSQLGEHFESDAFAVVLNTFYQDHRAETSIITSSDGIVEKKKRSVGATRHIILFRHGQYNLKGATDAERILTEQGRDQAKFAGQRLSELKLPITEFVISTMARAQETGKIILSQFSDKETFPIRNDSLLEEGAPIPPIPEIGHWRPENAVRIRHHGKILMFRLFQFSSSSSKTDLGLKRPSERISIAHLLSN